MKRPKVILLDIDGCLKPPGPAPLDLNVIQILSSYNRLAVSDGIPVTLVSGRSQGEVQLLLGLMRCPIPGICENGAGLILPDGETVTLDPIITTEVLEGLAKFKHYLASSLVEQSLGVVKYGREWSVTVCPAIPKNIVNLEELCCEIIQTHQYPLMCVRSSRCVDIVPIGIDKGTGAQRFSEYVGIPLSETGGGG
jgi:hydroxymethylpyrimidine pyrophosphatase-like HAD family hydrolase